MTTNAKEVEKLLVRDLVSGKYRVWDSLPLEKDLAKSLGISRTALREVLKRLQSYGFIESKRGSPSKVRDFLREGNLLTLAKIAEYVPDIPIGYMKYLLELRVGIMPLLAEEAVKKHPARFVSILIRYSQVKSIADFVNFDWDLHRYMAEFSENPIALMLINSFESIFVEGAKVYFRNKVARDESIKFYIELLECSMAKDAKKARQITEWVMRRSLELWLEMKP